MFRVAANTRHGWTYFNYKSDDAILVLKGDGITDRDIMKDEIVIESDLNMRKMNSGIAIQHERKLRMNGIGYKKWFSGNKSYHIHTNFPELNIIKDANDLKLIKKSFLMWLYGFNEQEMSNHKIDMSLCGKHLIRLEHAWHPSTSQRKTLFTENETDYNKIPTIVWLHFYNEKRKKFPVIKGTSVFEKNCIMDIYRNTLDDGRKRAAFILFNNFKKEFGVERASKMLLEWNRNNNNYISYNDIIYIIDYYSQTDKYPSCNYIKEYMISIGRKSVCDSCPCVRDDK